MDDRQRDSYRQVPENVEENRAQRDSDAPPDAGAGPAGEILRGEDPARDGRRSSASGVAAEDDADGPLRKKQYREGADLVSGMD